MLTFRLPSSLNMDVKPPVFTNMCSLHSQGDGVVLVNIDEAGTLLVTNFRLLFLVSYLLNV